MLDWNAFDRWVAEFDVSDHAWELVGAVSAAHEAISALVDASTAEKICSALRDMDAAAWDARAAAADRREQTRGRAPHEFLRETLEAVDNLNLELGLFAHRLYCYASSGMVESAGPEASVETQRADIEQWIARSTKIVTAIPEAMCPMPFFRLIALGAGARWALDNERPITGDQMAALSALAREPGRPSVEAFERTRKTVQNLVAESLGASDSKPLEVGRDRLISAASALKWLRPQARDYFPSTWSMPELGEPSSIAESDVDYVLVPVARAVQHIDAKPFTPDARCERGYEIGVGCVVVEDYWEALQRLQGMALPRFRHPAAHPSLGSLPCEDRWLRVERRVVEQQLEDSKEEAAADGESLSELTATFVALIEEDARFRPHGKGHSRKLLRYESRTGKAMAVEKRKGSPVLYVARSDVPDRALLSKGRIVGSSPSGRNSNLNTIDTFKGVELFALRPTGADEVRALLDGLATT